MNERIKQLLEQATIFEGVEGCRAFDRKVIDQEKFAKLIVQECVDIISSYTVRMNKPGESYLHPIQGIKQHFGVEE